MNNATQDTAYFLSFCIEQYKHTHGLDGATVARLFSRYGVLDYLNAHYDVLHTQSHQWIAANVDAYIRRRKEEKR